MQALLAQPYGAPIISALSSQRLFSSYHPVLNRGINARAKENFIRHSTDHFAQVDVVRCPACSRQNLSWNKECSWCSGPLSIQAAS